MALFTTLLWDQRRDVTRLPRSCTTGKGRLDDHLLRRAGDAAAKEAILLTDAHGSTSYKRELLRVYLGRAVRQAADSAGSPPAMRAAAVNPRQSQRAGRIHP